MLKPTTVPTIDFRSTNTIHDHDPENMLQAHHPLIPIQQSSNVITLSDLPDLDSGDNRVQVFRRLSKTLKPAVLLKSWQRVCMLVAGIETSQECGQANIAALEKEIYDRYHGSNHRDPPIVG